ncbi:MAG TPA: SagB family peptide dehydrogenase [Vicinamibacterales bacterium]|nr:SagB family peptide dehydrogenase [Vicinamibacterales bacterium]
MLWRYRRSRHLVGFWQDGRFVLRNYAMRRSAEATPLVCELLGFLEDWRSLDELARLCPAVPQRLLGRLLTELERRTLVHREDRGPSAAERAMDAFGSWNPAAGFFHTATRDVPFLDPREAERRLRRRARHEPMPPPVKRCRGAPLIPLRPPALPDAAHSLARVLRERRTWRRFATRPIALDDLATLLGLACGVQYWIDVPGQGRITLRTSPSGGARHPIEAYVLAWNVAGLPKGLYHYAADRHALERLRRGLGRERVRSYLPKSPAFRRAAALVLFTAVFPRLLWRYPYARAYRAALVEAGHVVQTFCLVATALGLAPFSVMGLADSVIERDLGVDGVTEAVLYAAGVGARPAVDWAPLARGRLQRRPNPALQSTTAPGKPAAGRRDGRAR